MFVEALANQQKPPIRLRNFLERLIHEEKGSTIDITSDGVRKVVGITLASALLSSSTGCQSELDEAGLRELKTDRVAYGAPALNYSAGLWNKAKTWSEKLAREGKLYHSNLPDNINTCWLSLGENVGYGPSVAAVQDAFMNSESHRKNVLREDWTDVAVGTAVNGVRVYVTQVYMKRCD